MSVTGVSTLTAPKRSESLQQIERLGASSLLHGSESLCRLLRYLAQQALDHPGVSVKEYQIAVDVFGRSDSFDPRQDSTVRVQAGRLRAKLVEYYAGAGPEDSAIVELPRGSYTLSFHSRPPSVAPQEAEPERIAPEKPRPAPPWGWIGAVALLVVLLTAALTALGVVLVRSGPANATAGTRPQDIAALRSFWRFFIDGPQEPWVVFSNAEFVGRPETGMRYFDVAKDARGEIIDHYTGVGEVLGIHELDHVFTLLNHGLRVKRGHLLSLDDAKQNDVIFVGSPSENLALRDIPGTRDFVFKRSDTPVRTSDLVISNVHPRESEPFVYYSSQRIPLVEDYSIVALVPGLSPAHWALILAGTTTIGTQAAVEFVCRARNVEDFLYQLTGKKNGTVIPFEAVLRVKVTGGVPVYSEVVALRTNR
jgi:hypothetical protein